MADDVPIWRQMFDALEAPLRAPAEQLVNTEGFSKLLMYATDHWSSLSTGTKENMAKLMHLSNVPAYTDITRLSRQVGALTGKVETLTARLEALTEVTEDIRTDLRRGSNNAPDGAGA